MEAAWEHASEGLVLFGVERVFYINPAAAIMLAVSRERVLNKPLMLALRDHRLEALAEAGGTREIELRRRLLLVHAVPGALYFLDRTDLKKRLGSLEEARRVLAHEFRTPVAGMQALLEALAEGVNEEERAEVQALLRSEVARLARLVDSVDLEAPGPARRFSLSELRTRLERFLSPQLAGRSVELIWEADIEVLADPDAVYQVLLNLVENAVNYAAGHEVRVVSDIGEQEIRLEVRDLGSSLVEFESLFTLGKRGVHAAGVRGSGLGLPLVRRLAAGWGGEAFGHRWEGGNVFGVTFPKPQGMKGAGTE